MQTSANMQQQADRSSHQAEEAAKRAQELQVQEAKQRLKDVQQQEHDQRANRLRADGQSTTFL
jgi:hypothetical protein